MLNKFNKIIHTKFSKFLRFIFFLRYLFSIFLISIALFLIIPNFFNYEKKVEIFKNHLLKNYSLQINSYEKIEFKTFPIPKLVLINVKVSQKSSPIQINVNNLKIYPDIFSIYNFEDFRSNKIILQNNSVTLDSKDLNFFIKNLLSQKKNFSLYNLNINLQNNKKSIIGFKNISFRNFGYNKNLVTGRVFGKSFRIKMDNDFKNINLKLLETGIHTNINIYNKDENSINGTLKSKILNTNLRTNFSYNGKLLNIDELYLRNKDITFKNESLITLKPFLNINAEFYIEEFDIKIFKMVNFVSFLELKDLIKKINSSTEIYFKPKKFSRSLFDEINLKINLAYGRVDFEKNILVAKTPVNCIGHTNVIEEHPIIFFNCNILTKNRENLFKKFSIKEKNKDKTLNLKVQGTLNLGKKKINFKKITMNEKYNASKEDLFYFKQAFEQIILDDGLFAIYNINKIKKFILEIS